MIQKKSLRVGQGYVMDGSSALIVNDGQTSNDEQRSPTPAISTSEKRVSDTEEQVILELDEEDEFYTLDELDELDKSMDYLARKFSNIRVKKPKFVKSKGQSFNKDSSWKGKGKKAYIAEGKSWDDSDNDEDEEVGNYAFMALEQGDSSSSKSQQENAYLKNKLKCASEIEAVLREKLEKNEVKLKSFRIAYDLIGQYHEKNKPCANKAIGLDYEDLNNKRKSVSDKGKSTETEDVPIILKKVESPLFKACEVNFSEEELIIKQEIADEDKKRKMMRQLSLPSLLKHQKPIKKLRSL
ncbi:hypothetical protein AgCh_029041 [Apium graveolens]